MVCHALSYCVYGYILHAMVYQCVHKTENMSDRKKKNFNQNYANVCNAGVVLRRRH